MAIEGETSIYTYTHSYLGGVCSKWSCEQRRWFESEDSINHQSACCSCSFCRPHKNSAPTTPAANTHKHTNMSVTHKTAILISTDEHEHKRETCMSVASSEQTWSGRSTKDMASSENICTRAHVKTRSQFKPSRS